MDIDTLTLGQIKQLRAMLSGSAAEPACTAAIVGKYCVVRCRDAGVHAGIVEGVVHASRVVWLRDSRRLWRWWSAFTLSELADSGVRQDKADECKFSAPTPGTVELADWCELRPCSADAEASIREVKNANT